MLESVTGAAVSETLRHELKGHCKVPKGSVLRLLMEALAGKTVIGQFWAIIKDTARACSAFAVVTVA